MLQSAMIGHHNGRASYCFFSNPSVFAINTRSNTARIKSFLHFPCCHSMDSTGLISAPQSLSLEYATWPRKAAMACPPALTYTMLSTQKRL
jgi:hypothetical protein